METVVNDFKWLIVHSSFVNFSKRPIIIYEKFDLGKKRNIAFNGKITVSCIAHSLRRPLVASVDISQNVLVDGNNIYHKGSSYYFIAQTVRYI